MLEIVRRLDISRLMRARFSIDFVDCEAAKRCKPLSFIPGKFSSRNERRLDGSAFNAMFVKEPAGSPDIARCCSAGN